MRGVLTFASLLIVAMRCSADEIGDYGPDIFPGITRMEVCGSFRVMVVYGNGTDNLYVDEQEFSSNQVTMVIKRGFSFIEFNAYEASNSITQLSCENAKDGLHIHGKATSGHSCQTYSFWIVMNTKSGEYKYSDTQRRGDSCPRPR